MARPSSDSLATCGHFLGNFVATVPSRAYTHPLESRPGPQAASIWETTDYTIFYHRLTDAPGEAGWISQLRTGGQTYGSLAEAFLGSPEYSNNAQVP